MTLPNTINVQCNGLRGLKRVAKQHTKVEPRDPLIEIYTSKRKGKKRGLCSGLVLYSN